MRTTPTLPLQVTRTTKGISWNRRPTSERYCGMRWWDLNCWVCGCRMSFLDSPVAAMGRTASRLPAISQICMYIADNVHLSTLGYRRLAVCIIEGIQHAKNKMISAECIVSGEKRSYFESIRGSFRQNFSSTNYKLRGGRSGQPGQRGGRGSGHHPYRGNCGKSGR